MNYILFEFLSMRQETLQIEDIFERGMYGNNCESKMYKLRI